MSYKYKQTGLARKLKLLDLVTRYDSYNTRELADILGVSRRTIFRDLRRLRDEGVLENSTEQWCATDALSKGAVSIPIQSWVHLYFHIQSCDPTLLTSKAESFDIWNLLTQSTRRSLRVPLDTIANKFRLISGKPSHRSITQDLNSIFNDLIYARSFRCEYRRNSMLVSPYAAFFDRDWYLIARTSYHKKNVTLKMKLIRDYSRTDINVEWVAFRIENYLGHVAKNKVA